MPVQLGQMYEAEQRLAQLGAWLERTLGARPVLKPASSDASFRRYYRIACGRHSRIVMDAPPAQEPVEPFARIARKLAAAGIHVPEILASEPGEGFMLLGDLGTTSYLEAVTGPRPAEPLYRAAIACLVRMQARCDTVDLPEYDRAMLERETALFGEFLLERHLGLTLSAGERTVLSSASACLAEAALAQPQCFVHRDYHSRNLMVSEPLPGVLDFQGAVRGPVSYDLVSLLRDCYIAWPADTVARWLDAYLALADEAGVQTGSRAAFLRGFDLVGVQRHLKAAGIFARLAYRDGKPGYLADVPRVLGHLRKVCPAYPELHELDRLLSDRVVPRLAEPDAP